MFEELLTNAQFMSSYNPIFMFNTAYRNNSTTDSSVNSNYSASDFAREPETTGRALSRALVDHTHGNGNSIIHVSIHGYSLEKRPEYIQNLEPTPNDVVLGPDSNATDLQHLYYQNLVGVLPGSYICGEGEGNNWPEDGGLCGNTDEMYKNLILIDNNQNILDAALHLETETERRKDENYPEFTTKLTSSLLATLFEMILP
jgi:hypothetical protein